MLGDLLRETREQKNLSLEDVEQGTNIRKLYIKAIEDGNYEKLPGEVFLKGFIKTYGKFLGLNSQELIEQYKNEKNAPASTEEVASTTKAQEQPISPAQPEKKVEEKTPVETKSEPTPEKNIPKIDSFATNQAYLQSNKSNSKRNIFLVIIILIIIIGGAVFFLSSQSTSDTKTPVHTTEQQPAQQEQQPTQPAPAPVVSGAEVKAVFSEDCWTEVKVDGNVVLSETVKKGTTLTWKGNNQVDISVGNAGAIDITFNNQPVGKLGDIGAVVSKSFVAPNAQAPANAPQQNPAPANNAQPQNPAPAANANNAQPAANAQNSNQQAK